MCTGLDRMDFPKVPADFLDWSDRQEEVNELIAITLQSLRTRLGEAVRVGRRITEGSGDASEAGKVRAPTARAGNGEQVGNGSDRGSVTVGGKRLAAARSAKPEPCGARCSCAMRKRSAMGNGESGYLSRDESLSRGWSGRALALLREAGSTEVQANVRFELRQQPHTRWVGCARGKPDPHEDSANLLPLAFDAQGQRLLMDGSDGGPHQDPGIGGQDRQIRFNSTNSSSLYGSRKTAVRDSLSVNAPACFLYGTLKPEKSCGGFPFLW